MEEVRFETTVGEDQVIRLPAGVSLPSGKIQVTVRSAEAESGEDEDDEDSKALSDWLIGLAREAEAIAVPHPSDMAANHDHYAHGKPRP